MPTAPRRRRWGWLLLPPPLLAIAAAWWFTEPLEDRPTTPPTKSGEATAPPESVAPKADAPIVWPQARLDGDEAKKLLLASNARTVERLGKISGYTAIFRKKERLNGKLGDEQVLDMKCRNRPFAIYLKFRTPYPGKEVVYAEGHHDNKVVAHNNDWTRRIVPRLAIAPDSPIALADNRHPITEAGLVNLANRLLKFREMDIGDTEATTVLDRIDGPDGRTMLRSTHAHTNPNASRPFARVEVFYDPETQFPVRIMNYDWPGPGHRGELDLAEMYSYEDLKLDAPLTDLDFDPANPAYAFMRF